MIKSPELCMWYMVFSSRYFAGITLWTAMINYLSSCIYTFLHTLTTISLRSLFMSSMAILSECWTLMTTVCTLIGMQAPSLISYSTVTYTCTDLEIWLRKLIDTWDLESGLAHGNVPFLLHSANFLQYYMTHFYYYFAHTCSSYEPKLLSLACILVFHWWHSQPSFPIYTVWCYSWDHVCLYLITSTDIFILSTFMNTLSNVWALLLNSNKNIASLVIKPFCIWTSSKYSALLVYLYWNHHNQSFWWHHGWLFDSPKQL